ncbi:hypothetical protein [Streptomyces scopuliridis]|uniref:Uncharacterized protein n=1 Tax=Streptomyces scopuliridis TaxID=452529 RepID=A0ACD4ZZB3_9ACTN|nr:hypothetical protein [Streptomyces scopuliridis]WSC03595.1 hypothetical protein OG835_42650 [Streptomyces scopuliridis]
MTDFRHQSEIQPYTPQPLAVPPGMAVAYTPQGEPVYIPQTAQPPVIVQMPTQPVPAWIRNGLLLAVGLLILCTPATVLLVVAAPAVAAMGQAIAYGGIGIGIGVIGVAAGIKALRETPRPPKKK